MTELRYTVNFQCGLCGRQFVGAYSRFRNAGKSIVWLNLMTHYAKKHWKSLTKPRNLIICIVEFPKAIFWICAERFSRLITIKQRGEKP